MFAPDRCTTLKWGRLCEEALLRIFKVGCVDAATDGVGQTWCLGLGRGDHGHDSCRVSASSLAITCVVIGDMVVARNEGYAGNRMSECWCASVGLELWAGLDGGDSAAQLGGALLVDMRKVS